MKTPDEQAEPTHRWERRRWLARLVRVVVLLAPAIIATDISLVLTRVIPHPEGVGWTIAWWVTILTVSGAALFAFDRLFRRLLPLTLLLDLALVFPGVAPSRYSTAFRAGTVKNIQHRIDRAKDEASGASTAQAAATVVELIAALAVHDPRTRGHCERTRAYSELIAEELGLQSEDLDKLRWSALLHDIGKLHVHAGILNKPGRPDPDEWESLLKHPTEGARIVGALGTWLGPWGLAIVQHHERFDGAGYPNHLQGHDISLAGRIVAVADAYEVMTSRRSYAPPVSPAAAREELVRCAGGHFDPQIVHAFLRIAVTKFPRRVGILAGLAQIPGFLGIEQILQQGAAAVIAGTAVTGLALGGLVAPAADGLGGLEGLGRVFDGPELSAWPGDTPPARRTATTTPTIASGADEAAAATASSSTTVAGDAEAASTTSPGSTVVPPAAPATTATPAPAVPGATTTVAPQRRTSFLGATAAGTSLTPAELSAEAPGGIGAPDHDRDGVAGRTLDPSPKSEASPSIDDHQAWIGRFSAGTRIVGTPVLQIASAVADNGTGRGTLRAVLLDCDANGVGCTVVSKAALSQARWSDGSGSFAMKTIRFPAMNHVLAADRTLVLRIGVPMGSEPLLIAYATATHPSALTFDVG